MCIRDRGWVALLFADIDGWQPAQPWQPAELDRVCAALVALSLIHISEPTRLLSISYAVFCLKKKTTARQLTALAYSVARQTLQTKPVYHNTRCCVHGH